MRIEEETMEMTTVKMKINDIAKKIGIDWAKVKFSPQDLAMGIKVEKEHASDPETAVIDNDIDAAKIAWAHLKESPKYYAELKKMEKNLTEHKIFRKIAESTVTVEDFDALIKESTPESIRNRLRKRINPSDKIAKNHRNNDTGHTKLGGATMSKRVQPKRKPSHQQSHGISKIAHKHSTKTQKRNQDV